MGIVRRSYEGCWSAVCCDDSDAGVSRRTTKRRRSTFHKTGYAAWLIGRSSRFSRGSSREPGALASQHQHVDSARSSSGGKIMRRTTSGAMWTTEKSSWCGAGRRYRNNGW